MCLVCRQFSRRIRFSAPALCANVACYKSGLHGSFRKHGRIVETLSPRNMLVAGTVQPGNACSVPVEPFILLSRHLNTSIPYHNAHVCLSDVCVDAAMVVEQVGHGFRAVQRVAQHVGQTHQRAPVQRTSSGKTFAQT